MEFTHGPLEGDLEIAFAKISEACSCLDECLRLLKVGTQCNQAANDQHHDAILLHANRIKEHAAEIQVVLIALSDESIQSEGCSLAVTREQLSAIGNDLSHSVAVATTDRSKPALKVVRSTDNGVSKR